MTTAPRPLGRRTLLGVSLAATSLFPGCSWFGEEEKPRLPGDRKPVLLLDEGVKADPGLASMQITLPPPVRNSDWAQAGGNPTHANYHLDAADSLAPVWDISIGRGAGTDAFLNPPVIANGTVYAVDGDVEVSAIDAATGDKRWTSQPEELPYADRLNGGGIAFDGGRLYLATTKGVLICLDAGSGNEIWRRDVRSPLRGSPAVVDGRVLVISADNQSFALDGQTGELVWQHTAPGEIAAILGGSTPAAAQGIVIVPYSSGEVNALSLETGIPIWTETVLRPRRTLAIAAISDIDGLPVIDRDRVFVGGTGGEIAAFDLASGGRIYELTAATEQTPWPAGDFVYLLSDRGEVICMLRQNGLVRWVSALPREREEDTSGDALIKWHGPVLVRDRLLAGSSDGELVSVSPYTGEILGRLQVGAPIRQPPIVADGSIYLLTEDGTLHAYR
ncbi:MAG TPA: PQQ-binding-like beta-propeller repeat protein [Geminicoccus sp.]|uniref:outer membrane protein assembly factor BamB family protein n=1 Tax=Geminicoccus sp. TaxID=2024832 RepID=UPI002E352E1E|nr:PQQ-binding-like beta-propeller repeat protein [Geminicoccus sp.]HEX2529482.1 PQQ-binding-like beta-propeller repeat protein [Geminicoccus sp.]